MLLTSAGMIVSCGGEDKESDKKEAKADDKADKDGEESEEKDGEKKCSKGDKCNKGGEMCQLRTSLDAELSDDEKTVIADARAKAREVMGDTMFAMVANSMCDINKSCCSKKCSKDSAKCKKDGEGEKKCCKSGEACCAGGAHALMNRMMDMNPADMKAMHEAMTPTGEALKAIADAHAEHFNQVRELHTKRMTEMMTKMGDKHKEIMDSMEDEQKAMFEEMHKPEHMEQMMIVHYLLMDGTCLTKCSKPEAGE